MVAYLANEIQNFPGDGPKVTVPNLRFPAVFCENLWFSAKILRNQMLEFPGEGMNLRKSVVFCENLRFGLPKDPAVLKKTTTY